VILFLNLTDNMFWKYVRLELMKLPGKEHSTILNNPLRNNLMSNCTIPFTILPLIVARCIDNEVLRNRKIVNNSRSSDSLQCHLGITILISLVSLLKNSLSTEPFYWLLSRLRWRLISLDNLLSSLLFLI